MDIDRIETSLRAVQADFDRINASLDVSRDPLEDEIVSNMVAGYRYVNLLLEKNISLLQLKGLRHLLELNHIVLCGTDPYKRIDFHKHIKATTERFYKQKGFCINDTIRWAQEHKNDSPWKRAAGVYLMHVSQPQLFIEGNHRTGALLMSSILARNGKPPFVLSVDNAKAYFNPSSLAKKTNKDFLGKYYTLPKIKKKFAQFLEDQADPAFFTPL
jgi:prophage maintenance system killer protein